MLHLLCARAGAGKSEYLTSRLREVTEQGEKAYLIVPEQFSHQSERDMTMLLGNHAAAKVEVLSFKKLAREVFSETGFVKEPYLTDGGRNLMMARALQAAGEDLKVYRRAALRPELCERMLSLVTELKTYCILPDMLLQAAEKISDRGLSDKLMDFHLIYSIYEGLLRDSFADPADDLSRLAMALEGSPLFSGAHFFLDSFKGFTAQEYAVLELLMPRCAQVWVSLCCGGDGQENRTVFFTSEKTKKDLSRMASKYGVEQEEIALPPRSVFAPEVAHLEKTLFAAGEECYPEACENVRVFYGRDIFEQAEYTARMILELVHQEGYRFGDFVIIARDLSSYGDIFETVFQTYGISVYLDKKSALLSKPVLSLFLSAVDILGNNFQYEDVFSYLRTGLTGLTAEEIDLFESYVYLLDIKGERMLREFTYIPAEFSRQFGEPGELLTRLDTIREAFIAPLLKLREADGLPARDITRAVYGFLIGLGVPANIEERGRMLSAQGKTEEAAEYGQLWGLLMDALDQMVFVSGDEKMKFDTYGKLLRVVLEQYDMGSIPAMFDRVTIGSAERIRVSGQKCAFLVGFNDGVFPKSEFDEGLLPDSQKKKLEEVGLPLSPGGTERMFDELFFVYCALTAGSERLFLSCCDSGKGDHRPSYLLARIRRLLPGLQEDDAAFLETLSGIYSEETAFQALMSLPEDAPAKLALRAYFEQHPDYQGRLRELQLANQTAGEAYFEHPENAARLYGKDLKVSPSRVELYESCPFAHFMKYGLRATPRRQLSFDALETGTFVHYVLQKFVALFDSKFLAEENEEMRKQAVDEIVSSYVSDVMRAQSDTKRFRYLFARLRRVVDHACTFLVEEFRASKFRPADFELVIGDGQRAQVAPLLLEDGEMSIRLTGMIDRVDTLEKDGKLYVRVVDYKTGPKEFQLSDAYNGLNLQMLLYLFAIEENGEAYYHLPVERAGILYMPASFEAVQAKRGESPEEILEKHFKACAMSGLLVDDMEVLRAMEPGLSGQFIPVSVKKDGTLTAYSTTASRKQFDALKKHAAKILGDMGREILQGALPACPVSKAGTLPCEYCDFWAACRRDKKTGAVRSYFKADNDELYERMEEEKTDVD